MARNVDTLLGKRRLDMDGGKTHQNAVRSTSHRGTPSDHSENLLTKFELLQKCPVVKRLKNCKDAPNLTSTLPMNPEKKNGFGMAG